MKNLTAGQKRDIFCGCAARVYKLQVNDDESEANKVEDVKVALERFWHIVDRTDLVGRDRAMWLRQTLYGDGGGVKTIIATLVNTFDYGPYAQEVQTTLLA